MRNVPFRVLLGIQAREKSTRFPQKIYAPFGNSNVLETIVQTCKKVKLEETGIECVTSILCSKYDMIDPTKTTGEIFQASCPVEDVLKRYVLAMTEYHVDAVVRITSDCPLITSNLIERAIIHITKYSYVTNTIYRTYPDGYDIQAITDKGLNWIYEHQHNEFEHPFYELDRCYHMQRNFINNQFSIYHLISPITHILNPYLSFHKFSVDTEEDLVRCQKAYDERISGTR